MSAARPRLKHPVRWNCGRGLGFAAVFVVMVVAPIQSEGSGDAGSSAPTSAQSPALTATSGAASTRRVSFDGPSNSTSIPATTLPTIEPATATVPPSATSAVSNVTSTTAPSTATNPAIASGPTVSTTDVVTTDIPQTSNDSVNTTSDTDAPGPPTTSPTTTDLVSSTSSATGPISNTTTDSTNEGTSQQQAGDDTTPGGLSDGTKAVIGVSVSVVAAAVLTIAVYMIIHKRKRIHSDYATNYEVLFEESDS